MQEEVAADPATAADNGGEFASSGLAYAWRPASRPSVRGL